MFLSMDVVAAGAVGLLTALDPRKGGCDGRAGKRRRQKTSRLRAGGIGRRKKILGRRARVFAGAQRRAGRGGLLAQARKDFALAVSFGLPARP
jgi:hypothetical protein